VKEEEANPQLYSFIESSLHILDLHHEGVANFHLCFLLHLSKYLGFYPQHNSSGEKSHFDLRDGVFRHSIPPHPLYLEINESRLLEQLMSLSFENMHTLLLNGEIRNAMVKHLLRYFELHLHSMQEVKSHHVLEAVLN
jgi:DNA repair protein RecO (recombination protein O)